MSAFRGVYTAIVTPFLESGIGINEKIFRTLIERQINAGINGLIISGSTGEGQTQHDEEWESLLKIATSYKSQIQILGACGQSSTWATLERLKKIESLGASGALVSTPSYNKPPQRGMIAHYQELAAQVKIPLMVYNIPGRTAVALKMESMLELLKVPTIFSIKESAGDLEQMIALSKSKPQGKTILSGEDPLNAAFYHAGGDGTVSVVSNVFPQSLVKQWKAAEAKDWETVLSIQQALENFTRLLFAESNPIPVKAALSHILKINLTPRAPLVLLDPVIQKELSQACDALISKGFA